MPMSQNVTMMSLRNSYCTAAMRDYRTKKIFPNLDGQDFLEVLAKSLNTSREQLLTTYIGNDESEFPEAARELVKAVRSSQKSTDSSGDRYEPL